MEVGPVVAVVVGPVVVVSEAVVPVFPAEVRLVAVVVAAAMSWQRPSVQA
jgi:hypothetical protein